MRQKFVSHLSTTLVFLKDKKLLLAVSGGIDSMVMSDLFLKNNFQIGIAHCNFQLRGEESSDDQKFIESYASKNSVPCYTTKFDTQSFANDYKVSIQVAARELRYKWFYELLETQNFNYILTAHHADDNLETFLMNLSRGTGIEGLTGIPQQNKEIVRPLLPFSRDEIECYAEENNVEWREDSSNSSDKYLRNKIRHDIVPTLKEINHDFLESLRKTQSFLKQTQIMAEDAAIMVYQQVAKQNGDEIHFDTDKIKKLPNYKAYLYYWLQEFGFTAWEDIYNLVDGQSGKQIFSPQYRLFKARHYLILASQLLGQQAEFQIVANQLQVDFPIRLRISKVPALSNVSNNVIFVDAEKLQFPLTLRKWGEGDDFQPFGMEGKSKKVSKFFKDEKFSVTEKEKAWLLVSGNQIVWIVGFRADERFKVTDATKNIIQIALL